MSSEKGCTKKWSVHKQVELRGLGRKVGVSMRPCWKAQRMCVAYRDWVTMVSSLGGSEQIPVCIKVWVLQKPDEIYTICW